MYDVHVYSLSDDYVLTERDFKEAWGPWARPA